MRVVCGVKCKTWWISESRVERGVLIYDDDLPGWVSVATIWRQEKTFRFDVWGWLFKSGFPLSGERATMIECLETIVEQWKDYENRH